ncbi:hypothetical protein OAG71_04285 [bacterium]|nr:hypothetical protein [bacterium]
MRFSLQFLIQAGVATNIVETNDAPAKILLRLSSITRGDLAPIGARSGPWEDHTVEMNWNKIVFEITYAHMLVHNAHKFVDALNAIVDEYRDGDERFVVYALPRRYPTTAYLDKPVVESLSQRFGIVLVKAVPSKT